MLEENQEDVVRVLRILEYTGPRQWVETTMSHNWVKGTRHLPNGARIREGVLGDYPEALGSDPTGEVTELLRAVAEHTPGSEGFDLQKRARQLLGEEV